MLHKKNPREQNGRDSFSRYKAQIRSAAMASISILEGKGVDWVYCDFHDDFVIRIKNQSSVNYTFYQVKTKGKQNHNWSINELSGINLRKNIENQDLLKIKDSFIGKLLLHTIVFNEFCNTIVFQTNINNSDDVEEFIEDIRDNKFENKITKILIDNFNEIFKDDLKNKLSLEDIKNKLSKLSFDTDVEYLKENKESFEPIIRDRIYSYSEIDLTYGECKEIIIKLLNLVEEKSSGVIREIKKDQIEKLAGISIKELLEILCITFDAYQFLLESGDKNAVRNASIIQRTLTAAGFENDTINYCSRCKSDWDIWLMKYRHIIPSFELLMITSKIRKILKISNGKNNGLDITELQKPINDFYTELQATNELYGLSKDLILGGVFAELVKGKV